MIKFIYQTLNQNVTKDDKEDVKDATATEAREGIDTSRNKNAAVIEASTNDNNNQNIQTSTVAAYVEDSHNS